MPISIHALREEGDGDAMDRVDAKVISIHALREEGDQGDTDLLPDYHYFYPRPPRGGRPVERGGLQQLPQISIHALREEGDRESWAVGHPAADFYPRPPRGGRRCSERTSHGKRKFLSTPSARRATRPLRLHPPHTHISIHALREEGDEQGPGRHPCAGDFYPRPPRGGRRCAIGVDDVVRIFLSTPSARRATRRSVQFGHIDDISIHALREEGDLRLCPIQISGKISIHALREEGDQQAVIAPHKGDISIHALREEGDETRARLALGT